jgi:hypothetical protein
MIRIRIVSISVAKNCAKAHTTATKVHENIRGDPALPGDWTSSAAIQ